VPQVSLLRPGILLVEAGEGLGRNPHHDPAGPARPGVPWGPAVGAPEARHPCFPALDSTGLCCRPNVLLEIEIRTELWFIQYSASEVAYFARAED
jgi:hypothetical protein